MKLNDHTGKKFGKLVVVERTDDYVSPQGKHQAQWLCLCECGNHCTVRACNLVNGHTTSCGCAKVEQAERNEIFMERICPYNNYVNCDSVSRCPKCGWNPTVSERRLKKRKGGFNDDGSEHNNEACEAHPGNR